MSFRSEDDDPPWESQRLKRNYPSALPVFSVDTEEDADELFTLAASRGYGPKPRMGLPHILQEDIANIDAVAEHLDKRYAHMQRRKKDR